MEAYYLHILFLILNIDLVCCTTDTESVKISRKEFERLKNAVSDLQRFAADQDDFNKRLLDVTHEIKEENIKLKAENLQREKENKNLVEENRSLKANNLELRTELQEMEADLKKLHSEVESHETVIQSFQALIPEKGEERNNHEGKSHSHNQAFLSELERIRRNIHVKNVLRKRHAESTVAFFARITQRNENHLGIHQNIIFEDVVTNYGNGYNNHHGVFIAPVNGLYFFTTSILSYFDMEFWAAITVNGSEIIRFDGVGQGGRHGSGAQTAIVALKKGDDVSIQSTHSDTSVWGDKYSSFGGYLIEEFETDPSTIIG